MNSDPIQRFSSRVENYIKYRPRYPRAVIETLREDCGLTPACVIADIGSGTGILTELFLRNGNRVFAVEPNRDMRAAGERLLGNDPKFQSVAGSAEATTLADQSIDFAVAGQAFHWFDRDGAGHEFSRILKPDGWIMLVWNERESRSTPFLIAYEELLQRYAIDYKRVDHRRIDEAVLAVFFGPQGFRSRIFSNRQVFDFAGLQGRLLSSSYTPEPGHSSCQPMLAELRRIFELYQENGRVSIQYKTRMYYGRL